MQSLLSQYARQLHARAESLAQEAAGWNPDDLRYPAERHAEIRRRRALLWNHAVDIGAILLHAAILRAFNASPRIQTRIFQLRAQMTDAIKTGKLPCNYRSGMPMRSSDYFLVQIFEETCVSGRPCAKGGSRSTTKSSTPRSCSCASQTSLPICCRVPNPSRETRLYGQHGHGKSAHLLREEEDGTIVLMVPTLRKKKTSGESQCAG
jgi:hypothetical protein